MARYPTEAEIPEWCGRMRSRIMDVRRLAKPKDGSGLDQHLDLMMKLVDAINFCRTPRERRAGLDGLFELDAVLMRPGARKVA